MNIRTTIEVRTSAPRRGEEEQKPSAAEQYYAATGSMPAPLAGEQTIFIGFLLLALLVASIIVLREVGGGKR